MEEKSIRKRIRKILLESYLSEGVENAQMISLDIDVKESDKNDIWKIKQTLTANGFKMYIVGGAVRDAVKNAIKLKKNPMDTTIDVPKDFDLATDASPDEIRAMFENAPFISNILHIGESFAIQFLVTKSGNRYELATFRADIGGGRKPDAVKFEKSPEEDAKRRDLTINALFYDINDLTESGFSGEVVDFVGGMEDIKNNVVNTVGDPKDRFSEDPLRKIRAIRFAAKMGSEIPKNVADAILDGNTSLVDPTGKAVSDERIRDEFYKGIKSSKSVKNFLELMVQFDFMKHVFAGLKINPIYFIEEKHPIIILAHLLKGNNLKDIERNLSMKRYSLDEVNGIKFLISLLNLNEDTVSVIKRFYLQKAKNAKPKINEKIYPITDDVIYRFAELNHIDKQKVSNLLRLANEFVQPSELLQSLGYNGRELGVAIERLEKEFYNNPDKVKQIISSGDAEEIKKIIFISKD
jgi:tRNA nucleotidyltransferase/poly(A) polymerase